MMACVAGDKAPTPEQLFPLAADEERARIRAAAADATAAAALADKSAMLARIAARNERINAAQQTNG